jgi:hypothetical protein
MLIHSLFHWLGHTHLAIWMQNSVWAFAVVEMFHLIAMAILGGAILIVELSLIGVVRRVSPVQAARNLAPLMIGSLATMMLSGVLLLTEETMKCYYSAGFRVKMIAMVLAIVVYFGLHTAVSRAKDVSPRPWMRVGGAISLLLWLTVGLAGRAIGFL